MVVKRKDWGPRRVFNVVVRVVWRVVACLRMEGWERKVRVALELLGGLLVVRVWGGGGCKKRKGSLPVSRDDLGGVSCGGESCGVPC